MRADEPTAEECLLPKEVVYRCLPNNQATHRRGQNSTILHESSPLSHSSQDCHLASSRMCSLQAATGSWAIVAAPMSETPLPLTP